MRTYRGELPTESFWLRSNWLLYSSKKSFNIFIFPFEAARWRGVLPILSAALIWAWLSRRILAIYWVSREFIFIKENVTDNVYMCVRILQFFFWISIVHSFHIDTFTELLSPVKFQVSRPCLDPYPIKK